MKAVSGSRLRVRVFFPLFICLAGSALPACAPPPAGAIGPDDGGAPVDALGASLAGHCAYADAASKTELCREYLGAGWTAALAGADCAFRQGTFTALSACSDPAILGRCVTDESSDRAARTLFLGAHPTQCVTAKRLCAVHLGGMFRPDPGCLDRLPADSFGGGLPVFEPPVRSCVDPKGGEPPGKGGNGQVCTWSAISASTEEGRHFADYGSCEKVFTQRPYYPVAANTPPDSPDPRLADAAYVKELDWVKAQIEASACVCCHSTRLAPRGHSQWYLEAPNNFMSSFFDSGLALGAGYRDSTAFGAYPPADNNGFDRVHSGFPSTDPARMTAFFVAELKSRGKSQADFMGAPAFGGPLVSERTYVPKACAGGEGIDAAGHVTWSGGAARYVYVLAKGAENPTVPPNLDLPTGTIWRVDVPFDGKPLHSGELRYGMTPIGTRQRFPVGGAPDPLVSGTEYYLYVLADVGIPVTRCLFTD